MTEPFPADVARTLDQRRATDGLGSLADRLSYVSVVSSTNDVAMDLAAAGVADGTAVFASRQTAGRGRRGRSWFSPSDSGLYLSVVFREIRSALVTLLAGVAVAEGMRRAARVHVELEWPNDLVVEPTPSSAQRNGRLKVGGILSESSTAMAARQAVVVGIGVNLSAAAYPEEIASRATSLEALAGRAVDRGVVLLEILLSLTEWREQFQSDAGAAMLTRWTELSPSSRGAMVEWTAAEGQRIGVTDGVDLDGALRVRSDGRVERLLGGALTWLPDRATDHGETSGVSL